MATPPALKDWTGAGGAAGSCALAVATNPMTSKQTKIIFFILRSPFGSSAVVDSWLQGGPLHRAIRSHLYYRLDDEWLPGRAIQVNDSFILCHKCLSQHRIMPSQDDFVLKWITPGT
jgi:hypothetical protein